MPKYYCDYCDIFLTHDSSSVRKAHNTGWKHVNQVAAYYRDVDRDKTQEIIDIIMKAYDGNPPPVVPCTDEPTQPEYGDRGRRRDRGGPSSYGGGSRYGGGGGPQRRDRRDNQGGRGRSGGDRGYGRGPPSMGDRPSYDGGSYGMPPPPQRAPPPPHMRYPPPGAHPYGGGPPMPPMPDRSRSRDRY